MERMKELIVVEGKHDKQKLERLFDCDVVCTNGLSLDPSTMELVKTASETRGVIVLTDADNPGNIIRKAISEAAPSVKHAFVAKKDSIGKRNVGIEYAYDEAIREALNNLVTFEKNKESLSWPQYLECGLMGNARLREKVCDSLHLGYSNNKTLFKRLNMIGIDINRLQEIINE